MQIDPGKLGEIFSEAGKGVSSEAGSPDPKTAQGPSPICA